MYKLNSLYLWEQNYSFIVEGISIGQLAQNLSHKELHNDTSWVLLVAFKFDEFVKIVVDKFDKITSLAESAHTVWDKWHLLYKTYYQNAINWYV